MRIPEGEVLSKGYTENLSFNCFKLSSILCFHLYEENVEFSITEQKSRPKVLVQVNKF